MRIPPWTPELKPQPEDLVASIRVRRRRHRAWRSSGEGGGESGAESGSHDNDSKHGNDPLLGLDRALLWSEPLARGWNAFVGNVRSRFDARHRKLREFGICCVALLLGSEYEYTHHAPDFLAAGGSAEQLERLRVFCAAAAGALERSLNVPAAAGAAAAAEPAAAAAATEAAPAAADETAALGPLPRDLQLAAALAAQMTRTPPRVDAALAAELRQVLGTDGLVELVAAIAAYNMVGRLLVALDIRPEDDGGVGSAPAAAAADNGDNGGGGGNQRS